MKRRAVLGLVGAGTVSSGVLGDPSEHTDEEPLAERFDSEEPSRPACDPERPDVGRTVDDGVEMADSADTKPYPDPPAAFGADEVLAFVRDHERAYVENDARCFRERSGRIVDYRVRFDDTRRFDWYDEIHVIRLRYAATARGVDEDGEPWQTPADYGGAVYGVDETAAVRTGLSLGPSGSVPTETETPDPLETGTLVDRF